MPQRHKAAKDSRRKEERRKSYTNGGASRKERRTRWDVQGIGTAAPPVGQRSDQLGGVDKMRDLHEELLGLLDTLTPALGNKEAEGPHSGPALAEVDREGVSAGDKMTSEEQYPERGEEGSEPGVREQTDMSGREGDTSQVGEVGTQAEPQVVPDFKASGLFPDSLYILEPEGHNNTGKQDLERGESSEDSEEEEEEDQLEQQVAS